MTNVLEGDHPYPPDIVESVHSNLPGAPEIKIEFTDTDVTIAADSDEDDEEDEDEEDEEDEEDNPFINRQKSKKSKSDHLHSFF